MVVARFHGHHRERANIGHLDEVIFSLGRHDRSLALLLGGIRLYLEDPTNASVVRRAADQINDDSADAVEALRSTAARLEKRDEYVTEIAQGRVAAKPEDFASIQPVPCTRCDGAGTVKDSWYGLADPTFVPCPECGSERRISERH